MRTFKKLNFSNFSRKIPSLNNGINIHKFIIQKNFALKFRVGNDICYYKLLNIDPNSSIEDIKREYYKLAKKYHPDNNENSSANQIVKF
jgi:preprotein translocase subunit Sec63